jgi:cytosine/adenosine deaminase-related metal-dependent hydrolase
VSQHPNQLVIEGCAIATMDDAGTEYRDGYIVVTDGRITAVGEGRSSAVDGRAVDGSPIDGRAIDGRGCLATPGLINTHHHLYQWLTQGMAQNAVLFDWLTELYPIWARVEPDQVHAAAAAGLAHLALAGCTTSTDHHYIFPPESGGRLRAGSGGRLPPGSGGKLAAGSGADSDALAAEIDAARGIGLRFHPCRGSMDLGHSSGGLPPDNVVEDTDAALAATEDAIARYHDPSPSAMLRIAVAPCSPFSVTARLMRESAELARRTGVRLHTHLAETREEDAYCRQTLGQTPAEYLDDLGWLGPDTWLAHCVHLDEPAIKRLAVTGTGVAHCPSSNARLGAGIAPVRQLLSAAAAAGTAAAVGLGVDGAASSEGTSVAGELRQALLVARIKDGPAALSPRQALWLGTRGGARCLGRENEIGALRPGMLADIALWRLDTLAHDAYVYGAHANGAHANGDSAGDPVAALVFGPPAPLELLLVGGEPVVENGELRTADVTAITRDARAARRRLLGEVAE